MKTFEGPGKYLVISLGKVTNPKCKAWDGDYANPNKPRCICLYPRIEVPFGWHYQTEPHVEIFGPKTYERGGIKFQYGAHK